MHAGLAWRSYSAASAGNNASRMVAGTGTETADGALHVRLAAAPPAQRTTGTSDPIEAATSTVAANTITTAKEPPALRDAQDGAQGRPDRYPPLLDPDELPISIPDAPMPEGGVTLRAFVQLNELGQVEQVTTATDAATPQAFPDVVNLGLRQSHLGPDSPVDDRAQAGLAYCLVVRFGSDNAAPRLQWLPGAARDAAHCLGSGGNAMARDISRR